MRAGGRSAAVSAIMREKAEVGGWDADEKATPGEWRVSKAFEAGVVRLGAEIVESGG